MEATPSNTMADSSIIEWRVRNGSMVVRSSSARQLQA
jgi:hypothetical protein